jgi:hypothetical protein
MYNKPVASLEKKKADVEVSADEIIAAYEADENAANGVYNGKVVQVTGKVSAVTEEAGTRKIQLETSNPMALIICEMETGTETGDVMAGNMVSIKGMCTGYLSDVILVQCTLAK